MTITHLVSIQHSLSPLLLTLKQKGKEKKERGREREGGRKERREGGKKKTLARRKRREKKITLTSMF